MNDDDAEIEVPALADVERAIEALLFAAAGPLALADLARRLPQGADVAAGIEALRTRYAGRGVELAEVAGRWRFQTAEDLAWEGAKAWAAEQGGELPTRPVAALLFANVQPALSPEWHWTADKFNASSAWGCYFGYGGFNYGHKSSEGAVVAVRLIPITA